MTRSKDSPIRRFRVLAVDDEQGFLDNLNYLMARSYDVCCVTSAEAALHALQTQPGFDVALLDLNLGCSDTDGIALLHGIHQVEPRLPVIMLTGSGSIERAIEAMKAGASDYLLKGADYDDLDLRVTEAIYREQIERENRILRRQVGEASGEMIGDSPAMQDLWRQIQAAAPGDDPVLITGETGTGKELVFKALHAQMVAWASAQQCVGRKRVVLPFDTYNCAARPGDEFRMTLFGSEEKRFANMASMPGKLEEISVGVLLLDEISKVSRDLQAQILRVVEYGTFSRVGSTRELYFRGRIVAATNCVPQQAIADGTLLEDLYYRLAACEIRVPPLRARVEDVPALTRYFAEQTTRVTGLPPVTLTSAEIAQLSTYHWPGNVRQLKQVVSQFVRACAIATPGERPNLRALVHRGAATETAAEPSSFADLIGLPWMRARAINRHRLGRYIIPRVIQANNGDIARAAASLELTPWGLRKLMRWLEGAPAAPDARRDADEPTASDSAPDAEP